MKRILGAAVVLGGLVMGCRSYDRPERASVDTEVPRPVVAETTAVAAPATDSTAQMTDSTTLNSAAESLAPSETAGSSVDWDKKSTLELPAESDELGVCGSGKAGKKGAHAGTLSTDARV